ncbi:HNH endonuclease [Coleofasciculus sp. FACHB-1120]|uniref:HNH endonuclease n=1 Tax=Coleofasciculus sp. FACHB-1120 TaxID=2692783 RepID=UPI001683FDD0|nr:HNH endonuclease [Coleofasciculus sp. FACHB-1120]MBD2740433.1 hypothetical protein [Coleofasciculus sp. FACHB-1120]
MFTRFEKLPIRVSELKTCFYCGDSLPATEKEHIFNSSWGGSHKTGDLICNECNNSFSRQIDSAFSVYVEAVMNAWSFKGERHKDVPKIILGGDYFLDKGAILKLQKAIIEDELQPDGTIEKYFVFNSKSQAKRWIEEGGMASWLGRLPSVEEQKYFKELIKQATPNVLDAKPQKFSAGLNFREQYRSSAHTIFKCLKFYLPEWISSDLTKPVQQFARYDQGDWRFFAVNVEQIISIAEQAASIFKLGVYHNSVEVYWCSHLKMVIGVLTILHRVRRTVIIAQNYCGPDAILYVAEDTYGSKKPPQALFAEFDSKKFSLPLLGVQYFASLPKMEQFFDNELRVLMTRYYPIDAITARLIEGIKALNDKTPRINETAIEEYVNLFVEFISNLSKILGVPIDSDRARTKLFEYGFSSLANQYIGRACTDLDVTDLMVKALDHVMKDCNLDTP